MATSDLEAICRMTSLWLRSGGSIKHVVKQLQGIGSSLQIPTRNGKIMSLGDGLAAALKKYLKAKERFGLKSLLLGEVDLSDLDRPAAATPAATIDRPLTAKPTNGAKKKTTSKKTDSSKKSSTSGTMCPSIEVKKKKSRWPKNSCPSLTRKRCLRGI